LHSLGRYTERKSKLPTFYLLNPTSLAKTNAKEQLLTDISTVRADLALIVETWFTSKHLDIDLSLDGYALFRRDRVGRNVAACVLTFAITMKFLALSFFQILTVLAVRLK
jgi:hypothetical protein